MIKNTYDKKVENTTKRTFFVPSQLRSIKADDEQEVRKILLSEQKKKNKNKSK